ncbi:MAG TPA: type VI secretion system-associated FHA domain protein TagH, partial [Cellvibrionaceae bacterium]|nr:type VI secretion system-associated FHA domain protein TagH [Cellvibrionaceae bacterium]
PPPPAFRPEPASPPPVAPVPDALGDNPFAHLGQSAGATPVPLDASEGQVYPIGSAFSTHVPASTPGKVPLSDRLKAMQGGEANDTSAGWATPPEPQVPPQAPPVAPPVPPIAAQPVQPIAPPAARQAPIHDTGVQNLIAALGLGGQLSAEQEQVLPQLIGEMTRESISGLLQILRARNSIKNEFRIAVTTIQPRENNPIKFATDVDDALELLFVRSSKGYKPPVESVQDSFESIMDHQVAILAGIRAAFKSLLSRFDPLQLEQQFERQGKTGGILPGMKGAKCWSAYDDFYQDLIGNFENSFQNLFGDEFVQAYEEQLRKLAIARKREHSQR